MGKACCILCKATREDIEYFKFPVSRALRAAWLAATGTLGDVVCAAHFAEDDYKCTRGQRRLRATAVPSRHIDKKSPSAPENEEIPTNSTDATDKPKRKAKGKSQNKKKKLKTTVNNRSETTDDAIEVVKEVESCIAATNQEDISVKENGNNVSEEKLQNEEKDIEDMITNYQIKQNLADRLNPKPLEGLIPTAVTDQLANSPPDIDRRTVAELGNKLEDQLACRLASRAADASGRSALLVEVEPDVMMAESAEPVFIEVPVDRDAAAAGPQDCVMLLESVQCEVDPSSLMLERPETDGDSDMEIIDIVKKDDPISLLTSSDEDEVIIQEPHIDTVEVSDESDEDDRPLQRLVKPKPPKQSKRKNKSILGAYEFFCAKCSFKTLDESEYKEHMESWEHSTVLQVCLSCTYTTYSKPQFARHKRKHKEERLHKCHLCNYKARHNMSLMYHLKGHYPPAEKKPLFSCEKCGFDSDEKSEALQHVKTCDNGEFTCGLCSFSTKKDSKLQQHVMRWHPINDSGLPA